MLSNRSSTRDWFDLQRSTSALQIEIPTSAAKDPKTENNNTTTLAFTFEYLYNYIPQLFSWSKDDAN